MRISPQVLETHPQIPRSNLKLLWHSDFWDGPMSGMLLFDGETCWFDMILENENEYKKWYRRFAVIRLSPDQLAEERYWHELFRQHVGTHTDYDNEGQRKTNAVLPQEDWYHFYDRYNQRTKPDYSVNTILGWFET